MKIFWYWTWFIRAALRHEMGRWYVFRDVPWAVVARIATWPIPDGDAAVEAFVQAARDELALRARTEQLKWAAVVAAIVEQEDAP